MLLTGKAFAENAPGPHILAGWMDALITIYLT
jgi:hypothetical protein